MPDRDVLTRIREDYPSLAWLATHPEVGPLLRQAVDPNEGFSPQVFNARLMDTNWYKNRSLAQRQWEILQHTDPGEAHRRFTEGQQQLRNMAQTMGFRLTAAEARFIAKANLASGIDMDSPQARYQLAAFMATKPGRTTIQAGSIGAAGARVREMASEYFIPHPSKRDGHRMAVQMAMGVMDENAIRQQMQLQAISRFPHLRRELLSGRTMHDITSGHRNVIAQELELAPDSIDFTKGRFSRILNVNDPESGPRLMTMSEAQKLARMDERWWGTSNGRQADAGMANFLLQTFGKRA